MSPVPSRGEGGPGRARRIGRLCLIALGAWPVVAWGAARALVVRVVPTGADAMVVLSGSQDYAERALWAAHLFREGRAPTIILTNDGLRGGWSAEEGRNPFFFERSASVLREGGVPAESIETLPEVVSSTHDEAVLLRRYATGRGLRSLLVVTSPHHSRRALWTFRRVFAESGVGVSLDAPPAGGQLASAFWWLSAHGWGRVGGEYPKLVYYWCAYR